MAVDKTRAYALREQGMTFKEMAAELGCSEIYLRTTMAGVPKGRKYEPESIESELKRISKDLSEVIRRFEG